MLIKFSPVRSDDAQPVLSVAGDVLTVNGDAFDFSPLTEGATVQAFAGVVTRAGGVVEVTILLPHGANAPQETRFPAPVLVESGPVPLPPYDVVQEVLQDD